MSLYKITVLTIQFTFFFQTETLFECEFVLDASKIWFISLGLLCCNMTGRDCIFVLILDNSDKKHVFLFFFFFFQDWWKQKGKNKNQNKQKPQSRAIFSSVSRPFFQMREEGHRNLCMCCFPGYCCCCRAVAHLWKCTLWTLSAVLWGLALPPDIPFWRLLSSRQRQMNGKSGVAGLGRSQPALLNPSKYIGKHSVELRGWRGEINARETGDRAWRMEKSQEWRPLRWHCLAGTGGWLMLKGDTLWLISDLFCLTREVITEEQYFQGPVLEAAQSVFYLSKS